MHAFDRQTDRRTDRNLIARPRLHSMQRGKNEHRPDRFESSDLLVVEDTDDKVDGRHTISVNTVSAWLLARNRFRFAVSSLRLSSLTDDDSYFFFKKSFIRENSILHAPIHSDSFTMVQHEICD